jgi:hypothetical protein
MDDSRKLANVLSLTSLLLIGAGLYYSGLTIPYYGDDFAHVLLTPSTHAWHYFLHTPPRFVFYRPIEFAFLHFVQERFGLETLPIHLTALFLHILLSWLVFVFIRDLGYSTVVASLGSVFMLVSQANVSAVLGNDTLSQVASTFFGCLSLLLLYRYSSNTGTSKGIAVRRLHDKNYLLSIAALALALFSKESAVFFVGFCLVLLMFNNRRFGDLAHLVTNRAIEGAPFVAILALYLLARESAGAGLIAYKGYYAIHIGANVIRNVAELVLLAAIPVSSVFGFIAFHNHDLSMIVLVLVLSLAVVGFVAWGLWRSDRRGTISVLVVGSILGFFPLALIDHVNEVGVYNSMPLISVLVGIGLGKQLELSAGKWIRMALCTGLIVLLSIAHVTATLSKTSLMKECGERAAMMISSIVAHSAQERSRFPFGPYQ